MAVYLPAHRRSPVVDLNLVPFIDLLSCLIAFLMMTALWTDINGIEHDPRNHRSPREPLHPPAILPPPPLTLHLTRHGIQVFRDPENMDLIYRKEEQHDWGRLEWLLAEDYIRYPEEILVVINTDDGVPYGEMMRAWDLTRMYGLRDTWFAGGPPASDPMARPSRISWSMPPQGTVSFRIPSGPLLPRLPQ